MVEADPKPWEGIREPTTPTAMQLGVAAILCVAYSFVAPLFGASLVIMIILAAVWSPIECKRDRQIQAS